MSTKTRDEAVELIEMLKKHEKYQNSYKLRIILRAAADIMYKEEKKQIKLDI